MHTIIAKRMILWLVLQYLREFFFGIRQVYGWSHDTSNFSDKAILLARPLDLPLGGNSTLRFYSVELELKTTYSQKLAADYNFVS